MTLPGLINRECSIIRRRPGTTDDGYGNEIPEETVVASVCEIQQRRRDEPGDAGEVSETDWIGFFLPDESLRTADAIAVDGEEYEVVGDPWRARNPRTREFSHVEASLKRVAGSDEEVGS